MIHNCNSSRARLLMQVVFVLFLLYVGYEFYHYVQWAMRETEVYTAKSGAVEAFLPIASFMALKRLILTHEYDLVHPAGLTIFMAILFMSWLFRKGFCGHICPIGFVESCLDKLGAKLGIRRQIPHRIMRFLTFPKYLVLGFFIWAIGINMSIPAINNFMAAPYNYVADSKMLLFFLHPSTTTLIALATIGLGSMIIPYFWCRVLCPYGALLGLLSRISPSNVHRDASTCTSCKRCEKVCPAALPITSLENVRSAECLGCTECVSACPMNKVQKAPCLTVRMANKPVSPYVIGLGCLAVFLIFYVVATSMGLWQSSVPMDIIRGYHDNIWSLTH